MADTTGESEAADERPWAAVARLEDVLVTFTDLPESHGWWEPGERVIVLDRSLSQRQRRCVLAHELEHVLAGDEDVSDVSLMLAMRQEARAATRAARRLITLDALVDGLLWSQDEHELAEELHVDVDTLRTRLATLTENEHALIDERLWEREAGIA